MRIVGGTWRGRRLTGPSGEAIRPTSDRLREAIFNVLAHGHDDACAGARVIDLFAGTGAFGLEALSRGASHALFVDQGAEARALIRANVEALGAGGVTRIFRRDATKLGPRQDAPSTLAFLDPPYGKGLAPLALASLRDGGWLAPGALVLVEEAGEQTLPEIDGFTRLERRDYGDTQVTFLRRAD
ncbi:MAG: 16S rRNA (guanine(966)-N(2))-methyltransferase RsmD [Methylobacteriaceae bacterium]|nr:16S rRNA (guanine(966)-N(2))-methyltransferase RsmD [Methylobacteriaceae bacterium]